MNVDETRLPNHIFPTEGQDQRAWLYVMYMPRPLSLSLRISLSQTERSSPQQSIADPGWRSDQNREKKCTNLMGPVRKSSLKMVLYHKPSRGKKYRLLATSLSRLAPYFWDLSRFVFRHEGQYLCRVAWYVGYIVSLHHESFANCVPKFFAFVFWRIFCFCLKYFIRKGTVVVEQFHHHSHT